MNAINGIAVVNDIDDAIECLQSGETVARFECGNSMFPIFKSGEYAILTPIKDINDVNVGDAVLCQLGDHILTHLVWLKSNGFFLIGGADGALNGWTNQIFAVATKTNVYEVEEEHNVLKKSDTKIPNYEWDEWRVCDQVCGDNVEEDEEDDEEVVELCDERVERVNNEIIESLTEWGELQRQLS